MFCTGVAVGAVAGLTVGFCATVLVLVASE